MEKTSFSLISPADIQADPTQPRTRFERICELADSIREHGQLQAIVVRELPMMTLKTSAVGWSEASPLPRPRYQIVFGERRWRAASLIMDGYRSPLEDADIPADPDFCLRAEISTSPPEVNVNLEIQLIENLERQEMTMMEEARAYHRLTHDLGYTMARLTARIKTPRTSIQSRLKLLRLSVENQEKLDACAIPYWAAAAAVDVPPDAISLEPGITNPVDAALLLAIRQGDKTNALHAVRLAYIRPTEERKKWLALWELGAEYVPLITNKRRDLELFWDASPSADLDWKVLTYEESRELFDFGVTRLLPPTRAGGYRHGSDKPANVLDGLAPGAEVRETWEQLAARYGVPLTVACDGECAPVILVRSEMVVDAARTAHSDDPEACPFAIHDGKGRRAQEQAGRKHRAEEESDSRSRIAEAVAALRELEAKIWHLHRTNAPKPAAREEAFLECMFFLVQHGALGFTGQDNAFTQLLEVLNVPDDEADSPTFSCWPGIWEKADGEWRHGKDFRAGMESLAVLSLVLSGFREWTDEDLRKCPEWVAMAGVYGV